LVGVVLLWRTQDLRLDMNFIGLSFAPWLVYAILVRLMRGPDAGGALNTPRLMLSFLAGAVFSALMASPILSLLFKGDAFVKLSFDPGTWNSIFSFAYGDFIGQLIVAPLLIMLFTSPWKAIKKSSLWFAVLIAATTSSMMLLFLHYQPPLATFLLLVVFIPMMVLAIRESWIGACIAITLIGILFEIYLSHNTMPITMVIVQLAFALFAACSLLLGATIAALRDSHQRLIQQNLEMQQMNATLLKNTEELRHNSQRIIGYEEQGQRELANELDAELGQVMHRLSTNLNFAIRSVKEPETYRILSSVRDPLRDMEDSLRQVLQQLRPKILDEKGLSRAISAGPLIDMLSDAGITYELDLHGPLELLNEDRNLSHLPAGSAPHLQAWSQQARSAAAAR
jgi:glucose-6-phosphate-specific signal transduction histidine kinase